MKAEKNTIAKELAEERATMESRLSVHTTARRLAKRVTKRLRNQHINSINFDRQDWGDNGFVCYIFMSKKVVSLKDCSNLLAKIDDLPATAWPSYSNLETTNGWSTTDDKYSGSRQYTRQFLLGEVRYYIQLTAIPLDDRESLDGIPKCRRVVVGEKETVTKSPIYELVCEE